MTVHTAEPAPSVLCVVPARSGSKSVPGKNIRPLGGRPLIQHVLTTARQAGCFAHIIVSTDSEAIAAAARETGVDVPFLRPAEIAGDRADLVDVCKHAVAFFQAQGRTFDAVMSLQPTAPFIRGKSLSSAVAMFGEKRPQCVTSIAEISKGHPYIAKRLLDGSRIESFCEIPAGAVVSPRQAREPAYFLTGAFYLRNTEYLMSLGENSGHALGVNPCAVVVTDWEACDINSMQDFQIAEFLIEKGNPSCES